MMPRAPAHARVCGLLLASIIRLFGPPAAERYSQTVLPQVAQAAGGAPKSPAAEYVPNARFRLRTALAEGKLAFVGVGGNIDGVANATLPVSEAAVVQVDLLNDDGIEHDVIFPDFDAATERVAQKGASSVTVFRAANPGTFAYFCSVPGHRQAGMEGQIVVGAPRPALPAPALMSLARDPVDLSGPLTPRPPTTVRID